MSFTVLPIAHTAVEVHSRTSLPRITSVPTPAPRYGEVLVKVLLRPVNRSDVTSIRGSYPFSGPARLPSVPGSDGMGVVAAIGEGVRGRFAIGQRVAGAPFSSMAGNGSWQQFAAVDASRLVEIPDAVSDVAAAQFFGDPATALGLFETISVPRGEYLLNVEAGSSLGRAISTVAASRGVGVVNVVRRLEEAAGIVGGEVVVIEEEDVFSRVMSITEGSGVWGALDPAGAEGTALAGSVMRVGGTVVVYGTFGGARTTVSISDLITRDVRLRGFRLATWLGAMDGSARREKLGEVMGLLANGVIPAVEGDRYPLDEEGVTAAIAATERPGAPRAFVESY